MTIHTEALLEKVRKYFEQVSLAERTGGLKSATVYLVMTAGYEWKDNYGRPTFQHTEHILRDVERDLAAWEAMALVTKNHANKGLPLTPDMAQFINKFLDGVIKKPKRSSSVWKNLDRDLAITMAAHILNEGGLSVEVAREYVSELASEQGVSLSDESIKKIWDRHKNHIRETVKGGPYYYLRDPNKRQSPLKR